MDGKRLLEAAEAIRAAATKLGATTARQANPLSHEVLWKAKLNHVLYVCDYTKQLVACRQVEEARDELMFCLGILWFSGASLEELDALLAMPSEITTNAAE